MSKITQDIKEESVVLPVNAGLREAYTSILKSVYFEHQDNFWLSEIVSMVAADCGISVDTANDRCRQLVRFKLLKYLYSSLSGHRYIVLVFSKRDGVVSSEPVSDWDEFNRLVKTQFTGAVENDLMIIRKSMNSREESGLRETAMREVESVFKTYENSTPIRPGEDTIKSEMVHEKETRDAAAERFEKALRDSNGNDSTSENQSVLGG